MLAINVMGTTPTAIFYVVAVVLFILSGIGFKGTVALDANRTRRRLDPRGLE
jgi:hypothetical protein